MRTRILRSGALLCFASIWIGGVERARAEEMAAFGVNLFGGGTDECGTSTTADLSFCDDWVDVMEDAFDAEGWDQTESNKNNWVDGRDWSDSYKQSFGADDTDPSGADFAEVAMLCSRGAWSDDGNNYWSLFTMGDDEEDCKPTTLDHLYLGDATADPLNGNDVAGDLEVAILSTSQSAQSTVYNNSGYLWGRAGDGTFYTWLGFHGTAYDSQSDTNRFEDYVDDSFDDGLGENWSDELHRNPLGGDNDTCPVAYTYCDLGEESECDTQYEWGGFEDRHKVSPASGWSLVMNAYFVSQCDPLSGLPLPN
jgi:hypothetical protein